MQSQLRQRHARRIEQMQMQTAETEALAFNRLMDQGIGAVAAEPHLAHGSAVQGPIDQPSALAMQSPVEMAVQIQAVDRQVVESMDPKTLKAGLQSGATFVEGETGQQLAGDHPAMPSVGPLRCAGV